MNVLRLIPIAVLLASPACTLRSHSTLVDGSPAAEMAELWAEAGAARDLFWGVGGRDAAPDPKGEYRFVARDTTGKSPGYDVRDAQGRLWNVKLGPEAQSEVKRGVTPADVRWISERLARLTAEQWNDAFRAPGYTGEETARYVLRLREKVTEGLDVASGP